MLHFMSLNHCLQMNEQGHNKHYATELLAVCSNYTTRTHKYDKDAVSYLAIDSVDLPVLVLQF
jgi:hypothetical protein